ncbi:MAG: hypothetical protein QMD77_02270 [Patescibacteria group bacterium]|nr:hypothetical protein [Patescibacteria group bacterium]
MKKIIAVSALVAALAFLSGCGKKNQEQSRETQPAEESATGQDGTESSKTSARETQAAPSELPNLFTSQKFKFQVNYPDDYKVLDPSQSPPPQNPGAGSSPIVMEAAVQFLKEGGVKNAIGGSMISIIRHTNTQNKSLDAFAKDYLAQTGSSVSAKPSKISGMDFVIATYETTPDMPGEAGFQAGTKKVQVKSYFVSRGQDIFEFGSSSDQPSQDFMEKMAATLKFL